MTVEVETVRAVEVPTRLVHGPGAVARLGELVGELGVTRPLLSSTANYERWNRDGGKDAAARATEVVERTLEEYEEPTIDPDLRAQLKAYVDRRRRELGD